MLATPFTRETAADNARKAVISRERNRAAKKAAMTASPNFDAKGRMEKQIERLLNWMDALGDSKKDKQQFLLLSSALDRLWNKAFPTQGAVKSRGNRDRQPMAQPIAEVPQEPNL